ncbi:MAG: PilZ protein [Alphaproteobacteria bacterium]|nr:PilZ protein [Alphaproteobacteria bacterium]
MLGELIRRKITGHEAVPNDIALDSTRFSLTTDVPRPTEDAIDQRLLTSLPVAKLITDDWQDLCRIRTISAGGLMADTGACHGAGAAVVVELNSEQRIDATILWTRGTTIGVKFNEDVDVREILAHRRPRIGYRPRPTRLAIRCGATVRIGGHYHRVEVQDISLGGIKLELHELACVGKTVVVAVESLRAVKGVVRWYHDGYAGIVFQRPLRFEELAEWLGKRIEIASLYASTGPLTHAPRAAGTGRSTIGFSTGSYDVRPRRG